MSRHLVRLLLAVAVLTLASVLPVALAGPGFAHNSQTGSDPAAGAVLDAAPAEVSVTFDADLMDIGEALVVRAPDGSIVSDAAPTIERNTIRTAVRTQVPDGTFTVAYRVVSADGHTVTSTFTYTVAAGSTPAADEATSTALPSAEPSADSTPVASAVTPSTGSPATPSATPSDTPPGPDGPALPALVVVGVVVLVAVAVAAAVVIVRRT